MKSDRLPLAFEGAIRLTEGWRGLLASSGARWICVLLPWGLVTAYNLLKPFHIDDTAHLEIARWIARHPLHPMSGPLNWAGTPEPIYRTNQPHLFFYVMAGWGSLFGFGEISMHSLQAIVSLGGTLLFYLLARLMAPGFAVWLTALFVLCPAFAVEQNMMVDVPLATAWVGFFYALILAGSRRGSAPAHAAAACLGAVAALIKYSSLVLLPILAAVPLLTRRLRDCLWAAVPLGVIVLWSLFNYWDYGGVHILSRQSAGLDPARITRSGLAWVIALGSICPFSVAFLGAVLTAEIGAARRAADAAVVLVLGLLAAVVVLAAAGRLDGARTAWLLRAMFFANGAVILGLLFVALRRAMASILAAQSVSGLAQLCCFYWLGASAAFYILFAPFIAVRHVLLTVPAALLLLAVRWGASVSLLGKAATIVLTGSLAAALAVSDWEFADFYRREAQQIANSYGAGGKVWFVGHWGWQWYAKQSGLAQLDVRHPALRPGDYLAVPENVDHEDIRTDMRLYKVAEQKQESTWRTFFCTGGDAGFYASTMRVLPWTLTHDCTGTITIYQAGSATTP